MSSRPAFLGIANSIAASVLFAVMYYYATLLEPLSGEQIYGWRILLTIPFLTCLLLLTSQGNQISSIWNRLCRQPAMWIGLLATSLLVGVQLWLFMWAPVNGKGLSVSLGYFLLPITLALTGRVLFNEKLSRLQLIACCIAGVGAVNELAFANAISWPTFVVALCYPGYFALRRKIGTNHMGGLWFDMVISLPVALWFSIGTLDATNEPTLNGMLLWVMILGLGMLSAAALACMVSASRQLSLGLFGLLTYVEPALLILVSLLLGERMHPSQWLTYGCTFLAILILIVEGARSLHQGKTRDARSAHTADGGLRPHRADAVVRK